jgi:hypothetical protein
MTRAAMFLPAGAGTSGAFPMGEYDFSQSPVRSTADRALSSFMPENQPLSALVGPGPDRVADAASEATH